MKVETCSTYVRLCNYHRKSSNLLNYFHNSYNLLNFLHSSYNLLNSFHDSSILLNSPHSSSILINYFHCSTNQYTTTSVGRWLDYVSIFGHLMQPKFAVHTTQYKTFTKVGSTFGQILPKIAKDFYNYTKVANLRQSRSH